uniref:Uncharacterized protein n=1 Tax=Trichuris muris TaxID=70415 RepID=A0A5S6PZD0_TRIMR
MGYRGQGDAAGLTYANNSKLQKGAAKGRGAAGEQFPENPERRDPKKPENVVSWEKSGRVATTLRRKIDSGGKTLKRPDRSGIYKWKARAEWTDSDDQYGGTKNRRSLKSENQCQSSFGLCDDCSIPNGANCAESPTRAALDRSDRRGQRVGRSARRKLKVGNPARTPAALEPLKWPPRFDFIVSNCLAAQLFIMRNNTRSAPPPANSAGAVPI